MAAIVYFEKTSEDEATVAYRYGPDEADLDRSFVVGKADRLPNLDPETFPFGAQLALSGILRAYRKSGRWPERGAGYT